MKKLAKMSHRSRTNLILDESYDDQNGINEKKFNKTGLSSEELKLKLIQVVKNKGIFDTMKVYKYYLNFIYVLIFIYYKKINYKVPTS